MCTLFRISKIQTLDIAHQQNNSINAAPNFCHLETFKVICELKTKNSLNNKYNTNFISFTNFQGYL